MDASLVRGQVIVSAQVPSEVREELLRRAREEDRSLSSLVRRAITAELERARLQDLGNANRQRGSE